MERKVMRAALAAVLVLALSGCRSTANLVRRVAGMPEVAEALALSSVVVSGRSQMESGTDQHNDQMFLVVDEEGVLDCVIVRGEDAGKAKKLKMFVRFEGKGRKPRPTTFGMGCTELVSLDVKDGGRKVEKWETRKRHATSDAEDGLKLLGADEFWSLIGRFWPSDLSYPDYVSRAVEARGTRFGPGDPPSGAEILRPAGIDDGVLIDAEPEIDGEILDDMSALEWREFQRWRQGLTRPATLDVHEVITVNAKAKERR